MFEKMTILFSRKEMVVICFNKMGAFFPTKLTNFGKLNKDLEFNTLIYYAYVTLYTVVH